MEERQFILDSLFNELCNIQNIESRSNRKLISIYWNRENSICSIDTNYGSIEIDFNTYSVSEPVEIPVFIKEDEEARLSDELKGDEKKVFDTICKFNVLMSEAYLKGNDKNNNNNNNIILEIGGAKTLFKNGIDNRVIGENDTIKNIIGDDLDFFVINMFLLSNSDISSVEQFAAVINNLNRIADFKGRNNTYTFNVSGLDVSDEFLSRAKDGMDTPVDRIDSISFNDCIISITRPSSIAFFEKGTKYFYNNCEFTNSNRFK